MNKTEKPFNLQDDEETNKTDNNKKNHLSNILSNSQFISF